jgi:hypothetical protein
MTTPLVAFTVDGLSAFAPARLPSVLPQSAQNFAAGALSEPQFAQRFDRGLPHSAQNFLPGIPSAPHFAQRIYVLDSFGRAFGSFQSALPLQYLDKRA